MIPTHKVNTRNIHSLNTKALINDLLLFLLTSTILLTPISSSSRSTTPPPPQHLLFAAIHHLLVLFHLLQFAFLLTQSPHWTPSAEPGLPPSTSTPWTPPPKSPLINTSMERERSHKEEMNTEMNKFTKTDSQMCFGLFTYMWCKAQQPIHIEVKRVQNKLFLAFNICNENSQMHVKIFVILWTLLHWWSV